MIVAGNGGRGGSPGLARMGSCRPTSPFRLHDSAPVSLPLVVASTVVAAVLAWLGLASTVARRRTGLVHLVTAGVLEAVLLVLAGGAGAPVAGGGGPAGTPPFPGFPRGGVPGARGRGGGG